MTALPNVRRALIFCWLAKKKIETSTPNFFFVFLFGGGGGETEKVQKKFR